MDEQLLKNVFEAALLAAGRPLRIDQLLDLFEEDRRPSRAEVRQALAVLQEEYANRGIKLAEVANGFRIQIGPDMTDKLSRLWQERPPRYSRATLETLALIAYRQPITRGEIEEIRGVSVSTNIMRNLLERNWVRIVGHRDVPGRPGLYATTRDFLDYFGLKSLDELPPLTDLKDLDNLTAELDLRPPEETRLRAVPDENEAAEQEDDSMEPHVRESSPTLTLAEAQGEPPDSVPAEVLETAIENAATDEETTEEALETTKGLS